MKENLVVQANELILATYSMSVKEKEILLSCVSQIDSRPNAPIVTEQTKFTVTTKQIADVFYDEGNRDNMYRDLKNASNRLFERKVLIKLDGNKELLTRFISGVLFDPDDSKITVTFAEDILPYLTQLSASFTKYRLREIAELSSIHAIRMYELIICWIGQFQYSKKFELDEFRHIMAITGKYKQFGQLREVITTAINEINENTDYVVSVSYRKVQRSYVGLTLSFHKKSLAGLEDAKSGLSDEKIDAITRRNQFVADYNDYHRLSFNGKTNTEDFRLEMREFIKTYPEEFTKRPLVDYLKA